MSFERAENSHPSLSAATDSSGAADASASVSVVPQTSSSAAAFPVSVGCAPQSSSFPVLKVENLSVGFDSPGGPGPVGVAVNSVSFSLEKGKILCLVGESGCGKSVTALSLLRLLPSPPSRVLGGSVWFDGEDLLTASEAALRKVRGNRAAMIFQDPMTSLNPVMRVGEQIAEGLRLHRGLSSKEARQQAIALLERVNIPSAKDRVRDFPHQMSGGMRQRVMIAMALACEPELLIADEPTTALDVTVQSQILLLMRSLIDTSGSSLLLITHDLGVVSGIADSVAVMYAGRIVEYGPGEAVLRAPAHPYTAGLIASRPGSVAPKSRLGAIPGAVPGLWARPSGCEFHPRCSKAIPRCAEEAPPLFALPSGVGCRCWLCA